MHEPYPTRRVRRKLYKFCIERVVDAYITTSFLADLVCTDISNTEVNLTNRRPGIQDQLPTRADDRARFNPLTTGPEYIRFLIFVLPH